MIYATRMAKVIICSALQLNFFNALPFRASFSEISFGFFFFLFDFLVWDTFEHFVEVVVIVISFNDISPAFRVIDEIVRYAVAVGHDDVFFGGINPFAVIVIIYIGPTMFLYDFRSYEFHEFSSVPYIIYKAAPVSLSIVFSFHNIGVLCYIPTQMSSMLNFN